MLIMKFCCLFTTLLVLTSSLSIAASTPSARRLSLGGRVSIWGVVSRGGGLFGGKSDGDKSSDDATTATTDAIPTDGSGKKFPALTQQEIEEWLEHIPVFAVTDSKGAGVVLKPENDTSVFYFFFNPIQANATLQQLKLNNAELDLKVSAFSLGKIWFNLINNDDQEVMLAKAGAEASEAVATKGVEYRLVPDTRDLLGARMLLTITPEDGEKLKESGTMTPEMAQAAIQRAMTESPKFKTTYNEIPVFTIAQMRMVKQAQGGDDSEGTTLLPMYFSLQNMVTTWQQFMTTASPDVQGVEPAINLMSLQDIVEMMQKESEIDWRHVVLVPTAPESTAKPGASSMSGTAVPDPMTSMGGATLGDDE